MFLSLQKTNNSSAKIKQFMNTSKKNIIIVFNNLNIGGIETKIIDICRYYSKQKNLQVTLFLKSKTGPLLRQLPTNLSILNPCITDKYKIKTLLFPLWIAYALKKINPNLIIAFGNYSAISTIIGKIISFSKTNIVISEDSSIIQQLKSDTFSYIRTQIVKALYGFSNSLIVLSKSGKNNLLKIIPSQQSKINILENWLPLTYPTTSKKQIRDIDILFLGRFEPQKNPLKFLDISKRLIMKNPKIKIVVVGYGTLKDKMEKYISVHKLNSNICIHQQTTESYKYFERAKIFLLSSDHEGFPLTILESTASGSLPICVNLEEVREYFNFEPKLILYNTNNEAVKNINYFLNNRSKLIQLSAYYQHKTINSQKSNFKKTTNFLNKYL